jgi:hypothetical protein
MRNYDICLTAADIAVLWTAMAKAGMLVYSGFFSMRVSSGIRDYFSKGLNEICNLNNPTIAFFFRATFI